ncbi:MAG: response regulator, partial [Erysipelotrichaceae bacterium]|nr:response regulator [Erysipelotrichaceae bacterium]
MPNRKNVLLVEDNEINMLILENILQDEYHVIKANDGIEALEIVKTYKDKISIILTDINMPKMDGYTFIKTLKKHDEYRKIPIIVMTQSDSEEEEITALDIGANDFLPKPYRGEVILHRVKNIINLVENVSMVNYIKNDSLTGLYTKEYFYSKAREILNNDEENEYFIICTNIENFKFYNDVFGQKA